MDVGLPATVPIAAFIADLVALIDSRNSDATGTADDPGRLRATYFTLARIGQEAIAPSRTLTEAEVHEGDLLVLREVAAKESPALFDDVIDAVSRLTATDFRGWSAAAARWTGLTVSVVAVVAAIVVLVRLRAGGEQLSAPALLFGFGIAAFVAASIAGRRYSDELTATWLALEGVLLASGGIALFVPGAPGGPHLLLGCSAAILTTVLGYRVIGTGAIMFVTIATVGAFGAIAAAIRLAGGMEVPKIGAVVLVAAIVGVSAAPRTAMALARLPLPPVPTAGAAIDPADHEPWPAIEGIGAIGATALPSAVGLGQRAKAANRFQSGIVAGCTVVAVAGALVAADPVAGERHWPGFVLAAVAVLVLCLRGRTFADLAQSATLICGGCLLAVSLIVGLSLGDSAAQLVAGAALLSFAVAVVGFGVLGPLLEVTPVTRRAGEVFEYLLIIALVPLMLWATDVYSTARNL